MRNIFILLIFIVIEVVIFNFILENLEKKRGQFDNALDTMVEENLKIPIASSALTNIRNY